MNYYEYVVDYEIYEDGEAAKWGTYTCSYSGYYAPNARVFGEEVLKAIGETKSCDPTSIRIKGIFKL